MFGEHPADRADCGDHPVAGAIIGVLMAVSDDNPLPEEALADALDILESTLSQ